MVTHTWPIPKLPLIAVGRPETTIGIVSVCRSKMGMKPDQENVWAFPRNENDARRTRVINFFMK